MKARPVAIIWYDAHHIAAGEWLEPSNISVGVRVTTVGLLVKCTKSHLVIAHGLDSSGLITGVFAIPRVCIRKVHQLAKGS